MSTNGYAYPANGGAIMPPTGKFLPRVGLPEIVALVATTGDMAPTKFDGPSEVKLMLTDGRPWYVTQAMADIIRLSGIQPRQQLEITKTGTGKAGLDWKIVPLQAHLGVPAAAAPPQTVVAAVPVTMAQPSTNQHTAPKSQLATCFEQACDAIKGAQAYANSIGLGITFTSEDVRSTAISAYIGCQKGGSR